MSDAYEPVRMAYRIEFWSAKGVRHVMHSLPPEAVPVTIHEIEKYDGRVINISEQL